MDDVTHCEPSVAPPRERPPNRRQLVRHSVDAGNQLYAVDIGFSALGRPVEVFISGPDAGSHLAAFAHDVATLISLALQHGVSPSALAKSIARVPSQPGAALELGLVGNPATVIGVVLDLLTKADHEPTLF
jgi:hypothetical protein